ncbi:unnamed protein product [Rhizoctonia solani]|uniref:CHAT domain-containing protein n=1 Tax=Rhizoctonia solani TaxID=456999 RepID=A0A8H3DIJ6_9AGAM|nr:unnamed protein product [Rhizoctonia solani]
MKLKHESSNESGRVGTLESQAEGDPSSSITESDYRISPKQLLEHTPEDLRWCCETHIGESIEYGIQVVDSNPNGYPEWHYALGKGYHARYRLRSDPGDIANAIKHKTRALELTPEGDLNRPELLDSLSTSYYQQFQLWGDCEDIEKSIEYQKSAVDSTPDDHLDYSDRLESLGSCYFSRFEFLGKLDDIEKAIDYKTDAINRYRTQALNDPDSVWFANLGACYHIRFQHLGDPDDVEKSIEHKTRALELTPPDDSEWPARNAQLGVSYFGRFRFSERLEDINEAIQLNNTALERTPNTDPGLPRLHDNLGSCYLARSHAGDIDRSIEHHTEALNLTPKGHQYLRYRLTTLASSYSRRGQLDDISKSIEYFTSAVNTPPADYPDLPATYHCLAIAQMKMYKKTEDLNMLKDCLQSFRKASQSSTSAPRARFQSAFRWAEYAFTCDALEPIEACQTAIDLLPQFIWLGATTHQRYEDLSQVRSLATSAATVAIRFNKYDLALAWLEQARCVVWNQTLMLRSPVDRLQASHPELATRIQTVATQLHSAGSHSKSQGLSASLSTPERYVQERHRLAKEYDELLARARSFPEFKDFLRPMKANSLIRAARNGPVVVINCDKDRCDALLILPGQDKVSHLPLPTFSEKKAQSSRSEVESLLRQKGLRERGFKFVYQQESKPSSNFARVLSDLWKGVVKPVLDFLGYTDNPPANSLPHVTWCPTGAFTFLPLHAAGDYDQPRSRVFDYVISSYTPTLTTLLVTKPSSLSGTSQVLAVGQANTPGHSALPGTSRELECLRTHTQIGSRYSQLTGDRATTAAVLDAMEHHDWVHLACHAYQNVTDATKSGFSSSRWYPRPCTATGDAKLPDEAIHLASGMLMAGYSSVIATMWSVKDADAPFVADKVYAQLMKDGKVGDGEVGKALHYAVAALREEIGGQEFSRWVPYIHIGP